jgi:hypothetical protein
MPEVPLRSLCQKTATSHPSGETTPKPVITTLRFSIAVPSNTVFVPN